MPHIDARTGDLVLRIVYDGSPEAGKTTNVHRLGEQISLQRRGASQSPGSTGPRTAFFDWLDFSGGYLDGRRVRCQLVTVPGQPALLHRRRYLLETADAVVFVTDSREEACRQARHDFSTTQRIASRAGGSVQVGLVVQANKQDLPGALAPAVVFERLGLPPATPVVPSVASTGDGVMQTFVLAVRLASDRVRALSHGLEPTEVPEAARSPEALFAAMQALGAAEPGTWELAVAAPARPAALGRPPAAGARRPNRLARVEEIDLPRPPEIASGSIWPPVKGRAWLAAACTGPFAVPPVVEPWAPSEALEVIAESGWYLHSSANWQFETASDARLRLIELVRRLLPGVELHPDSRTLAVARDRSRWRLWLVTPRVRTLPEVLLGALRAEPERACTALGEVTGALKQLAAFGLHRRSLPGGAHGLALQAGRLVVLAADEGSGAPVPEAQEPLPGLLELARRATRERPELRAWLLAEARRLFEPIPVVFGALR